MKLVQEWAWLTGHSSPWAKDQTDQLANLMMLGYVFVEFDNSEEGFQNQVFWACQFLFSIWEIHP